MGTDQAKALASILKEHPALKSLCGNSGDEIELNMSGKMKGAADAIMLVPEIIANGAMTSLNLANNKLGELVPPTGWKAHLAKDGARVYYVTEGQPSQWEAPSGSTPEGAIALANVIPDMRAMTSLNLASNKLCADGGKALAKGLKGNTVITELDISSNNLDENSDYEPDMSGVIALADAIPDMRALTSLDLSSNWLRAEGAKIVAEAIKVTMCTPAIIMAPFSCPSDFSINCCCWLLSAGYGGDDEPESCVK
jgi:hypothetical protein